jgi:phage-related protein
MAVGGPTVTLTFKGDTTDLRSEIAGIGRMVGGLGATVGILGGVGAAAGAASLAVAAVPLAFLGIGIAAAAQSQMVKDRFTELKDHVMGEMSHMTASIQGELLIAADHLQAWFDRLAPTFEDLFKLSAPYLQIFLDGIMSLVERALPGLRTALEKGTPIAEAFGRGLGTLGEGIGKFFANLTEGSPGAVLALDALFGLTRDLLDWLGRLIGQLANALGPAFAEATGPVMDIVKAMGEFLVPIFEAIAPLISTVAGVMRDILVPMFEALGPPIAAVVTALVEELTPILKEVGEWFEKNSDQIADIAKQLGTYLVEAIHVVGPFLGELVTLALKLAEALLPLIPPLIEIARNLLPVLEKVLNDLVIPALKWLVDMLIKYVIPEIQRWVDKTAEASRQFSAIYDAIKVAFQIMWDRIKEGIDWFATLGETARRHWDAMYQAIKEKIGQVVTEVGAMPQKLLDAILYPIKRFYEAGQSLIQAFADGINSKASAAQDAAGNVVGGTAALFPQSPAEEGPFSGQGYTDVSGRHLIEDFAAAIEAAAPQLYARIAEVVSQAQGIMSAAGELARHVASGGTVFEDLSFKGMSANLAKYNDQLAGMFSVSSGGGGLELKVAPGADSALSSLLMNLVRTGQLQLQRTG